MTLSEGGTWPLPLYELALLRERNIETILARLAPAPTADSATKSFCEGYHGDGRLSIVFAYQNSWKRDKT